MYAHKTYSVSSEKQVSLPDTRCLRATLSVSFPLTAVGGIELNFEHPAKRVEVLERP